MVLHDSVMTLQALGRGTPDAHRHPILLDVEGPDAIEIDETQEELEVGCHLVIEVVIAELLQAFASQVESGVSGDIAHPHTLGRELTAAVIAHDARRILGRNVMHVGIDGIDVGMLGEGACDGGKDIVAGEEVVTIEDADNIARSAKTSAIEPIVDSLVGTTLELQSVAQTGRVLLDERQGAIGAATVLDDQFVFVVVLSQHALNGAA